jgi:sugar phosphate permease
VSPRRPPVIREAAIRAPAKLHYAWIVAAVTFVVLLLTAGIRAAPGVLIVPFEDEFHWSRSTISFAIGVNLLLYGLIGPFAAALIDRFGVRRTMVTALAVTAAAVAWTSTMREPWQLVLLWGVVAGSSCGVIGNFLAALIAARWFRVRQGLVIGVLTAANAAGQLIFLPSLAALVTHAGWRATSVALAVTVAGFVPLIAIFMRNHPEDLGLAPYGDRRGPRPAPVLDGNPLTLAFRAFGESARSRDFWLIAGSYFVCGASTNGLIGTHLIPACIDHGLGEVTGAGLLAATGVFSFLGGTLSGWLSDRWDNRLLLAWYYGLRGLSLLYLPFAFDMSVYGLSLFSVFYGLDWIAGVPPTVRLLSRVVGTERTGIMVAWITVIHQVGGAAAAYLGGALRISFGSYLEAFLLAGLLCFAAALMALLIGIGGRRVQPAQDTVPAG